MAIKTIPVPKKLGLFSDIKKIIVAKIIENEKKPLRSSLISFGTGGTGSFGRFAIAAL
jgi:hypothetical protein